MDACEKARLGIQERDFLIATHKRSESFILAQGRALTLEVQQASAAIDGLYDRSDWAAGVSISRFCSGLAKRAQKQHCAGCQSTCIGTKETPPL